MNKWIKKLWHWLLPYDLDMQKYYDNEWKSGKINNGKSTAERFKEATHHP